MYTLSMKRQEPLTNEERLEEILLHLRRLDSRDRLRMWGGFIHGILALIPTIILLVTVWYFYENGPAILQWVTQETAREAAAVATGTKKGMAVSLPASPDIIEQLKKALNMQ